ncbi:hypothetical protein AGMMS4956_02700 [Bacteroidia bacterium]|nr:hypothetical protein AGMMS4956_02700 [Bacteroidia bacterium]
MEWQKKAIEMLNNSLFPVPTELNELDWKGGLSPKTDRLAQHLSAFANLKDGGILVFGVNNDGICKSVSKTEADGIIQQLGNIAHNNLSYSIKIEHAIIDYKGNSLLFIFVPEQNDKPVCLRGQDMFNTYCRSAGQTVKMSRNQVQALVASSRGVTFEQQAALEHLSVSDVLQCLNYRKLFELLDKNVPTATDTILNTMVEYGFCRSENGMWSITNLGAILFANKLADFPYLTGKTVIVRKYVGTNNREQEFEQTSGHGYAVDFEGLIDFIMKHLPQREIIETIRKSEFAYPRVAIREFVANAMIHQDFAITGMPITVEIFTNRLSITNPGAPLNDINRLIDLPPYSRNEKLAQTMLLLNFCERRGSGIDRAIEAVEKQNLPAVKFARGEQHTQVTLFPLKRLADMTKEEKVMACYQHACLMYEDNKAINNQSVRERFEIDKNDSPIASRIIIDTIDSGYIKLSNENIVSKKYATYIPFYGG